MTLPADPLRSEPRVVKSRAQNARIWSFSEMDRQLYGLQPVDETGPLVHRIE